MDQELILEPILRDLRLDFLRGMTLFVVLIDHIEDHTAIKVVRPWAPVSTCLFDGAEAFVFLSGLIFGKVVQNKLEREGFLACQKKAIGRALTIYLTYLITVWVVIGIGLYFRDEETLLASRLSLSEGARRCAFWSLPMCYQPWGFPILAVYTIILPFMPLLLLWRLRSPMTAWIIPVGLFIATQMIPGLKFARFPWGGEWTFSPFAWQFLFFVGLSLGTTQSVMRRNKDVDLGQWKATRVALFAGASAIFVLGLFIQNDWIGRNLGIEEFRSGMFDYAKQWSRKTRLGPVRLAHFMSFVCVLSMILPRANSRIWHNWILAPIIKCGQNSLAMYSFGVILMFLTIPAFRVFGETSSMILMVEFDCCALSVCLAYFVEWYWRSRHSVDVRNLTAIGPTTPAAVTEGPRP